MQPGVLAVEDKDERPQDLVVHCFCTRGSGVPLDDLLGEGKSVEHEHKFPSVVSFILVFARVCLL